MLVGLNVYFILNLYYIGNDIANGKELDCLVMCIIAKPINRFG